MKPDPILVVRLARETAQAYCALHYTNWPACVRTVLALGFSPDETRAILWGKWPRWASDQRKGNGRPTSADLARFLRGIAPGTVHKYPECRGVIPT